MSGFLIVLGLLLLIAGLLWPLLTKLDLGRLPGDIVVEREGFRLYIPLATSLLASLLPTLILWPPGRCPAAAPRYSAATRRLRA